MNRRAILLASSLESNPIPGVYSDLDAFHSFLRSNPGGGWTPNEIFVGQDSTKSEVLFALKEAKSAEYALVFFAGHGEMAKTDVPWAEMRMWLNSSETINEREINPGSPSCNMIFDCCRRLSEQNEKDSLVKLSMLIEHGEKNSKYRSLYDAAIADAERGLVKIFAAENGEAVADIHSFTQHLLYETNSWIANNTGILNVEEAVNLAKVSMRKENPQQNPQYLGGRRLRHFPFAVKPE